MTVQTPTQAAVAKTARRRAAGLTLAAALLAVTCVASLAIGTENVGLDTVWQAVTGYRDIGDVVV